MNRRRKRNFAFQRRDIVLHSWGYIATVVKVNYHSSNPYTIAFLQGPYERQYTCSSADLVKVKDLSLLEQIIYGY